MLLLIRLTEKKETKIDYDELNFYEALEKDKREWLWRLAFNYERQDINFDGIIDYFISQKDGYYLTELISAIGESLDIDKIIDKINDKELINYLKEEKSIISKHVSEAQFNRLISKLEE